MITLVPVTAAALVRADGSILVAERPAGKSLAGLWEFPGGKIDPGETPEASLVRELAEELGLTVAAADLQPLAFASHALDSGHLLLLLYVIRRWTGEPQPHEGQRLRWVTVAELASLAMPPADGPLVTALAARLQRSDP